MSRRPTTRGQGRTGRFERRRQERRSAAAGGVATEEAEGRLEYDVEAVDTSAPSPDEHAGAIQERLDARVAAGWRVVSVTANGPKTVIMVFERPVEEPEPEPEPPPAPHPMRPLPPAEGAAWPTQELLAVSATRTAPRSEPPEPVVQQQLIRPGRRRRVRAAVAAAVTLILAAAALAAVLVLTDDERAADPAPDRAAAPAPAPPPDRTSAPPIPSCADVPPDAGEGANVVCRTSSATITLAAGTRPLLLPGLEARVFRATRAGATATIVVRVRNTTAVEQTVADVPPRFYLSVPGKQSTATVPDGVPVPIPPGEARTLSLAVALTPGQQRHLDRTGGRADFGVVPFEPPPDGERRVGVIRLTLTA